MGLENLVVGLDQVKGNNHVLLIPCLLRSKDSDSIGRGSDDSTLQRVWIELILGINAGAVLDEWLLHYEDLVALKHYSESLAIG